MESDAIGSHLHPVGKLSRCSRWTIEAPSGRWPARSKLASLVPFDQSPAHP